MEKKIVIIGAGIAGLSAGIYARLNGYGVEIVEMHRLPGGLCTAWKRGGYIFDGCIHWLVGSGPGDGYHKYWLETGALPGSGVVDHEEFLRIEGSDGRELVLHGDVDRLEAHLLELAPEDEAAIRAMCALIRRFAQADFNMETPRELLGIRGTLRMLRRLRPWLKEFNRYSRMPLDTYWMQFKSPFLRETLSRLFPMERFPVAGFLFTMAALQKRSAGWPLGGSLEFARRMERRFRELGGGIRYGARVETITVEGKRAVGVVLADGTRIAADVVVSAADGWTTVMKMLEGRFLDRKTARSYQSEALCPSALQLSFGVRMDLSAMPHNRCLYLGRKMVLAGTETDVLAVRHYAYDPAMAPGGCTAVVCHLNGDYAWWARLDRKAYEAAKDEVLEQVLALLDERIPGFRQAVEAADVATPLSFARYTGNREGSIMGWATEIGSMTRQRRRTLPGLRGFYMAGQWVESGGGLPPAVLSGRQVAELVCHHDGRPFVAGMPPDPATP